MSLVLGRYEVGSLYDPESAGSEASVLKGVDTTTGRYVAIKLFHRREYAVHEASIFQALQVADERNLIGYHGFDPGHGEGAIVLEAAQRCFFDAAIEDVPMTLPRLQMFLHQAASGLAAMHRKKIAHLDVKLENMLLTDHQTLKVADFGHATEYIGPHPSQRRSIGSANWRAPEIYDHREGVGPGYDSFKADVWSLGCAAYFLAVGHHPFAELELRTPLPDLDEYKEFAAAQASGNSGAAAVCTFFGIHESRWQRLAPRVQQLIDGCLQIPPARRWSLQQVLGALDALDSLEPPAEQTRADGPLLEDEDDERPVYRCANAPPTSRRAPPQHLRTRGGTFV